MTTGNVPSPAERLQTAAARLISEAVPVPRHLIATLLEGMAAQWAARPIADWNDYAITPLAALERHINGEETDRG